MIRLNQIKIKLPHEEEVLKKKAAKALRVPMEEITQINIIKKSLDARKKPDIFAVYTLDISLKTEKLEKQLLQHSTINNIQKKETITYKFPPNGNIPLKKRPIIIGMGPAGLFCGLLLARAGFCPLIVERGERVEERMKTVSSFWEEGLLTKNSNVQFGEGGAGTFSDGKLNTLVKDVTGRNTKVLEEFVKAGAKEEILYVNKPHIGTDELQKIVKNIRLEIESLGGEIRFETQVTRLLLEQDIRQSSGSVESENQLVSMTRISGLELNEKEEIETDLVVLAIGHSARDTFQMLKEEKVPMQAKAFAVGVRIEHPQEMINLAQYARKDADYLPAAEYKLTGKTKEGRGIYSFCMCPGGYVVNASSEEGRLAVNGMSYSGRDGRNANSAMIVTVDNSDFPSNDVLAGIEFQRQLEEKAFICGNGKIPVQLYGDFKQNQTSRSLGEVEPSTKGSYQFANIREVFPDTISNALIEGIESFEHKIKGFSREDAILSGVESRTSSPVRILRDADFESEVVGLYPCGEGAGYAGGITSAAMDGIKIAEAIAKKYKIGYSNK